MKQFRKRPLVVNVRGPLTEVETIRTANGPTIAHIGDYVLSDAISGDTWPIKPAIFAATYEPVPEEAGEEPEVAPLPGDSNPANAPVPEDVAKEIAEELDKETED